MDNAPAGRYSSLNPKSKIALYIGYAIAYAILFAMVFIVGYFAKDYMDGYYLTYEVVSLAILIITLAYIIVAPQIFYRHYKYALTDDCIDVLRGIIIIRRTVVPIERVHQVEVIRGPINNMLGLADVNVTTAGGIAKINFLDISVADNIAEELNIYINAIIRERKEND